MGERGCTRADEDSGAVKELATGLALPWIAAESIIIRCHGDGREEDQGIGEALIVDCSIAFKAKAKASPCWLNRQGLRRTT